MSALNNVGNARVFIVLQNTYELQFFRFNGSSVHRLTLDEIL